MASAPTTSATSAPPAAIVAASSLTRCCGLCPPETSRIARRGEAPIRPATERGKLSERPRGARAPGTEFSNCRVPAIVSTAVATAVASAPVSVSASRAASAASSTGERRR